jgi:hypothetical protein
MEENIENSDLGKNKRGKGRPSIPPPELRCKAKSRQTHEQCKNYKVPGYEVCCHHGIGKAGSQNRIKHETTVSGETLTEKLDRYAKDKELLNLNREISIMKISLDEFIKKVESDGSNLTNPKIMSQLNFLSQSVGNLVLSMSKVEANKSKNVDILLFSAILMQLKVIIANSINPLNLPVETKQIIVENIGKQIDTIALPDNT